MQMGFEVLHGGVLTLIQDRGRFGLNALGVSQSGVMDEYAYFWANRLLGNELNTNALEILWSNLKLKATTSCVISVTGADLSLKINDTLHKPWQTFNINAGDIITFTKTISGQRAYLAVKGGFTLNREFGSCSVSLKEGLGAMQGRALKKGDFLPLNPSFHLSYMPRLKAEHQPNYEEPLTLRVVLGYQETHFNKKEQKKFFSSEYRVTQDNNRMAIKLEGQAIKCDIEGIISEGIAFGSIQIPKDGQPIILLKERQTIGGYAKIGSVLSIDCFKLSQVKPNTMIRFEPIRLKKAQKKVREFYTFFNT